MIGVSTLFSREYLEWVVEHYGPEKLIQSSNIIGEPRVPIRPGEYLITYGTASELIKELKNEVIE